MKKRVAVFRKEHFNAAHRLNNPLWTEDKNREMFGKCNNPNYHGHNYGLEVKLIGEIDPETGYVFDLAKLSHLIEKHILDYFDHKNLNIDIPEFSGLNPTAENIAVVIYEKLHKAIDNPELDIKIRLYETERNYVEYPA